MYFLLSAWLESIEHDGIARVLPHEAKALPVRDPADVSRRFALVRQALCSGSRRDAADVRALQDAAAAFAVACQKLRELALETPLGGAADVGSGRRRAIPLARPYAMFSERHREAGRRYAAIRAPEHDGRSRAVRPYMK
ncbi:MAG TPA: hypothetical protein VED01_26895 [Burkholderiales bacterium]|nr:hypothetical protein [Burkholderiales bacterium]